MKEFKKNVLLLDALMKEAMEIRGEVRGVYTTTSHPAREDMMPPYSARWDEERFAFYKIMLENADWDLRKFFHVAANPNRHFVDGTFYVAEGINTSMGWRRRSTIFGKDSDAYLDSIAYPAIERVEAIYTSLSKDLHPK